MDTADVNVASMLCLPAKGVHAQGQNVIGLNLCPSEGNWAAPAWSDAHIEAVPLTGHGRMHESSRAGYAPVTYSCGNGAGHFGTRRVDRTECLERKLTRWENVIPSVDVERIAINRE